MSDPLVGTWLEGLDHFCCSGKAYASGVNIEAMDINGNRVLVCMPWHAMADALLLQTSSQFQNSEAGWEGAHHHSR